MQDVAPPHPQDLPAAELVEEALSSDLLVVIPLDQPVGQRDVVHGLVVLVGRYALPRESVEFLKLGGLQLEAPLRDGLPMLLALTIRNDVYVDHGLQVVWVIGYGTWLQVDKVAIILRLALQQRDQLIQILPGRRWGQLDLSEHFLRLLRRVGELGASRTHLVVVTPSVGGLIREVQVLVVVLEDQVIQSLARTQ